MVDVDRRPDGYGCIPSLDAPCGRCHRCSGEMGDNTPASVAQDATDATETPARTPGGSGTAEARTGAHDVEACPECRTGYSNWRPRQSATDPGMTNLEAELVALRTRALTAEADAIRLAGLVAELRAQLAQRDTLRNKLDRRA